MAEKKKVCLITGVGPGTGSALAERFAVGGYDVAMLARSTDRLREIEGRVAGTHTYACDVADAANLSRTIESVSEDFGMPSVVVHNAVGGAFGGFLDIKPEVLERNFQVNVMALLNICQQVVPSMIKAGEGVVMATGNTSAYRGKANFAGFAPTKAAQRILLESVARDAGPKGVHAAYVAIDAVIDVPWAREAMPDRPDDFFAKPVDIAEECFRVAHQPRSTWTFDTVIRPFGENW
jgi:NAD(P)-dependent dehydrogenase (short-subunit alcohol dehydrogenase family)